MSERYPKLFWGYSIIAPFVFMLSAAWKHNVDAAFGWGFAFVWVIIAGLSEVRLMLQEDEGDEVEA